jgi:pimeloyl-ACP methyl ester carboxylesterase
MKTILLLHGALGSDEQMKGLERELSSGFLVHNICLPGHGGSPIPEHGISIASFADFVAEYITRNGLGSAHIFGYSMGGYVAMYLAVHYPELVGRVITYATKFDWNEEVAAREARMLDADKIAEKVPAFVDKLKMTHTDGLWRDVVKHTARMMLAMGDRKPLADDDLKQVDKKCLLLLGDRDKMVTLNETLSVYHLLPNGYMGMVPGAPHGIEFTDIALLVAFVTRFLSDK